MFAKIRKLLKSETRSDLEAALSDLDIPSLEAELAAAIDRRTKLLLTGSNTDLVAAEKALEAARLDLDRAHAAKVELEKRLAAAQAKEFDETFLRQCREADEKSTALLEELRTKGVPAARVIHELLEKVRASDEAVAAVERLAVKHVMQDNAAGRSGNLPKRLTAHLTDEPTLLPGWARHLFFMQSRAS